MAKADPGNNDRQRDLVVLYGNLGGVAARADRVEEARKWYSKALSVSESLANGDPGNADKQRDLCLALARVAIVARMPSEAIAHLREARSIYERLFRGGGFEMMRLLRNLERSWLSWPNWPK